MQILTRRLLLVLLISVVPRLQAQTSEDTAKVRKKAMELYEQTKMMEALPLLEKVVAANPTDVVAVERLAFATLVKAIAAKKPDDQQQLRTRAQALAMRARDLGDDSDLLKSLLDALSQADKDVLKFSDRAEVDAAMREGESAFARGDFSKALKAYERALKLDPNQYEAALFSGDVYFKQKQMAKAGEWFERAIKINPDRETAYRYWGDALMADGKLDEARAKFVDAVIAEPYNRLSWAGLSQWANRARARLGHPRVDSPEGPRREGNQIDLSVGLGNKDDGSEAWMIYGITRSAWIVKRFAETFPDEKEYRHSLAEEVEALRRVVDRVSTDMNEGRLKRDRLDVSIANLISLHETGLLEPFILFAKPDEGIVEDYERYREEHRDKLRQYLVDRVIGGK